MTKTKKRGLLLALILPAFLVYFLFEFIPMIGTFVFSFFEWNGIFGVAPEFVGLQNFRDLVSDPDVQLAFKNIIWFVLGSIAIHIPLGLLLASLLASGCRGMKAFKAIYFMPNIFPLTAVALLWYFIYFPNNGLLNAVLSAIGLENLTHAWLIDSSTALGAVIVVNGWVSTGFFMTILFAGMMQIPENLYEAAKVDGANALQRFFHITVPSLKNVIKTCLILDLTGTMKVFDLVFAMTNGGPNGLTHLPTTLMYSESFKYDHYGLGSAIAVAIIIISLLATLLSMVLLRDKD